MNDHSNYSHHQILYVARNISGQLEQRLKSVRRVGKEAFYKLGRLRVLEKESEDEMQQFENRCVVRRVHVEQAVNDALHLVD